jgi:hypothetical protein
MEMNLKELLEDQYYNKYLIKRIYYPIEFIRKISMGLNTTYYNLSWKLRP